MKKKVNENQKVTLTIGQLKKLIKESMADDDFEKVQVEPSLKVSELIEKLQDILDKIGDGNIYLGRSAERYEDTYALFTDSVQVCAGSVMHMDSPNW